MLLTVEPDDKRVKCASKMLCWLLCKAQSAMLKTVLPTERHNGFIAIKALSEADAIASGTGSAARSRWKRSDRLREARISDGLDRKRSA